jgi:hypothetical protein
MQRGWRVEWMMCHPCQPYPSPWFMAACIQATPAAAAAAGDRGRDYYYCYYYYYYCYYHYYFYYYYYYYYYYCYYYKPAAAAAAAGDSGRDIEASCIPCVAAAVPRAASRTENSDPLLDLDPAESGLDLRSRSRGNEDGRSRPPVDLLSTPASGVGGGSTLPVDV